MICTHSKIHEENKHAPSRKKEVFNYLLSGKLICGDCNQKMVGISGTSKTGDTHYYYSCLSRTRKKINCNSKPIQKKLIEDLVIEITTKVIATESNINMLAQKISSAHKSTCEDNSKLKMLEKSRAEAVRSQNNIIKAIEQGIITSATKNRLNELETLITQYDFDIQQEKAKTESFLTVEQVKEYLHEFVNADTTDLNVRKLIINTFVRDVILYNDNIVITYNFKDIAGVPQVTKEYVKDIEQQIESADPSAVSFIKSSYISLARTPHQTDVFCRSFVFLKGFARFACLLLCNANPCGLTLLFREGPLPFRYFTNPLRYATSDRHILSVFCFP